MSPAVILILSAIATTAAAQPIPAFPGAEGAGAFATGGRPIEKLNYKTGLFTPTLEKRGAVYHVTTLDPDPGGIIPGSLRYGLKNENFWYSTHPFAPMDINLPDTFDVTPRIIVFDVGGTINLGEVDITPMNFTIAGQTAPGGITIYGGEFNPGHRDAWDNGMQYPDKTNNIVLRNFAIRTHDANEKDGLWFAATNSIADHLSMSWYTDEGVSITDAARNVTVQHSIIGPGWNSPDGDGSQIEGKTPMADISVHHNLYLHNDARIPRVGEKEGPGVELDFRNNVIYNWNAQQAGYSAVSETGIHEPSFTNFVNNYFIGGANNDSNDVIFQTGNNATRIYQSGNLLDRNFDGVANGVGGADSGWEYFAGSEIRQTSPYAVPHGVTQTPQETLTTVTQYAGANWWDRNFLDERAIDQLATLGNSALPISQRGQVLTSIDPADVTAVVNAPLQTRPAGYDSDNDGMPNVWEEDYGLNPNSPPESPDWNLDFDNDGYINVEEFINEIAEWPAPYDIVFTGGTNARYEQITNWSITRQSPGEANTTTYWQPSKYDVAVINSGNATVDSVGQHAGTIRLASGPSDNATLSITGGSLKVDDEAVGPGNGEVLIGANPGATAQLNLSGGKLTVKTLSKGPGGQFNFTDGVLSAQTINFALQNNGGILAPGESTGSTTIHGDLTINSGWLEIELASASSYDTVFVNGNTALGGNLVVTLLDGFAPSQESSFTILSAPVAHTISGTFTNLTPDGRLTIHGINGSFLVTVDPDQVTLSDFRATPPILAGDYNDDGIVDAADYLVWQKLAGTNAPLPNETASLGEVDEEDYAAWMSNFGATSSGSGGDAAVPEPSIPLLTLFGCLWYFFYREHRPMKTSESRNATAVDANAAYPAF